MNREQMWQFLEAYRDGVIDADAAARLALTIREGGANADWIVQELTFSGWIQQALQTLDEESFVRSFIERLRAEKGGDEFSRAFSQRLAVETQKIKRQEIQETRLKMPFRDLLGLGAAVDPDSGDGLATRRRAMRHSALLVSVASLAIIVFGTIYLLRVAQRPTRSGTFLEASPGVTVLARDIRREGVPGSGVSANETVSVPLDGHAIVNDPGNGRWRLHGGSTATFMDRVAASGHLASANASGMFLQTGVLAGEVDGQGGTLTYVATPHATAEFNNPVSFILSVTSGSTYVEVERGNLLVTRKADGRAIELRHGYYTVAADGADFEPLKK